MSEHPTQSVRRGAIAVIVREGRFLVIRRSQSVIAPGKYCFPGGGIEAGETEQEAVRRELLEELGVGIQPVRLLWRNRTTWHVDLSWWLADLDREAALSPCPAEVESFHWLTIAELRGLPELLESNHHFLDAFESGAFSLDGLIARPNEIDD